MMTDKDKELLRAAEMADAVLGIKKEKQMTLDKAGLSMRLYLVSVVYYLTKVNALQATGLLQELIKGIKKLCKEWDEAAIDAGMITQEVIEKLIKSQQQTNYSVFDQANTRKKVKKKRTKKK